MGVTEGVSSDGSSMPMIYEPAHMNSEIFERLRSSKYTPSVSHSLDSSLREGAGRVRTIHRAAQKPQGCGRFSSPLRNSETVSFCHPTGYSLNRKGTGDFHRPYENSETVSICHSTGYSLNRKVAGDFHRPYESSEIVSFSHATNPKRN